MSYCVLATLCDGASEGYWLSLATKIAVVDQPSIGMLDCEALQAFTVKNVVDLNSSRSAHDIAGWVYQYLGLHTRLRWAATDPRYSYMWYRLATRVNADTSSLHESTMFSGFSALNICSSRIVPDNRANQCGRDKKASRTGAAR